ncbi:MAG: chemotaxis protein CheD [Candidatus Nanohalobium sp.]
MPEKAEAVKEGERQENVELGEYKIGEEDTVLSAQGLGSCVGVALISTSLPVAGLAHVMLPASEEGDHAEALLTEMIDELKEKGVSLDNIVAKIFGGAEVIDNDMDIGQENIESAKTVLNSKGIGIAEEDVGGEKGRSIWVNCRTGKVVMRKPFEETKIF